MKNLNEMTDEQLALSYIEGSNDAFDLLPIAQSIETFFRIFYSLCVIGDAADDLFQENVREDYHEVATGKILTNR